MKTLFNTATGKFGGTFEGNVSYPSKFTAVDGEYTRNHKLVDGEVVNLSATELSAKAAADKADLRRDDRTVAFAKTIDKKNPIWWEELSASDKLKVRAYRKAWLDWPANSSDTFPSTITIDGTDVSTDVSDIFT